MNRIDINQLKAYCIDKKLFEISSELKSRLSKSFNFLETFSSDKIIYGINTGFGPMVQFKIDDDKLNQLQYNLIRSHSTGVGNVLDAENARAVVLARLSNFLQGNSGVSDDVVRVLIDFLNKDIIPEIFEHGGVGASGDLVQLAQLALNLIGEGFVYIDGKRVPANEALKEKNVAPLKVKLRDGLGLINGTSCMTGISAINLIYAYKLMNWSVASSVIINEIVEAYDDSFSEGLNEVKHHKGQQKIAAQMRNFLSDSKLIKSREELFTDNEIADKKEFEKKIQEYYSIRCIPQILGPILETLDYAKNIVEDELNSTNDNPVVSVARENVFHGGNFHGDYISLEMDKVRIVITKLTMLAERQLNFILNSKINKLFPPFLNLETLGLNFGVQGMQFTATSTTAESQMLSNSMYVHSISNNNDNQDIVSMGTNSALLTKKVIENGFQVMSIHLAAICQAIDILSSEKREKLSSKTNEVYALIRKDFPTIRQDVPQFENIKKLVNSLKTSTFEL